MDFVGTWEIYDMEQWDADYFNMEVQAYIKINKDKTGDFQFGLVKCQIDGEITDVDGKKRFEFTFEGNDECDPGREMGWIEMKSDKEIDGKFLFHSGDQSLFRAKRVKK